MKGVRGWGSLALLSFLLLAIGAAVAIPDMGCGSKLSSNTTAAIARMRNLVSAQERFREFAGCDLDGDGKGEYGTFAEMTGSAGIRADATAARRGAPLSEPVLSPALSNLDGEGIVTKSGYAFRVFLPARGGGAIHEAQATAHLARPIDPDAAETAFCAYAWPVAANAQDPRVLFVSAKGDVYATANADKRYIGLSRGPAWDGAFPAGTGSGWSAPPKVPYKGRDGREWTIVQ